MTNPFLYATGTNGFTTSPFSLMTTELNALTNTSTVVSSVGGSSGVFSQSNTSSAIFGMIWFKSGGTFTPTGTANLAGWFINSTDGGTTFEKSSAAPPRAPDFVIPLTAGAYAVNDIVFGQGGMQRLWIPSVKILIQNNSGVTLPSTGNVLTCGPIETVY